MNLSFFDDFCGEVARYAPPMSAPPIPTPCIRVCMVNGKSGLCEGCGRTLAEIAGWGAMDDARRLAIMAELPARLTKTAPAS